MAGDEPKPWTQSRLEHGEHGVTFVPIRHHSPACASALRRLLADVAPRQILIEAPHDFMPLLHLLVDPATRPPVAIVAMEAAQRKRPASIAPRDGDDGTAIPEEPRGRFVSYFPFCSHSPEFVAIIDGHKAGAAIDFIDLPSGHRFGLADESGAMPAPSFSDERQVSFSGYVAELCRATGCRDHNELWDHLFEQRLGQDDWRGFFGDCATYCTAVRRTMREVDMEADGTIARERFMASRLAAALARPERPIVVITGGMHTEALIAALPGGDATAAVEPSPGRGRTATGPGQGGAASPAIATSAYLIRYGFRELDRLNGYAAGMPSPAYYQHMWAALQGETARGTPAALVSRTATAELLTQFSTHLGTVMTAPAPSLPAIANALEQAMRLADLRGHAGPGRHDLIDACTSAFLKAENVAGSAPVLEELTRYLAGDAIGDVPPSAGSPPLVEAVRVDARRLGFNLEFASRRPRELDIYRSDRHLAASRFLHAHAFLETGFANRVSGPDFLSSQARDILFETWTVAWSPFVEARLIELSREGDELQTVLAAKFMDTVRGLGDGGQGCGARSAVRLLLTACLVGLQGKVHTITTLIGRDIAADPDLASISKALLELFLLWRGRQVLGLTGSADVEGLLGGAYRRALYLLDGIADTKPERLPQVLDGLATLREVVSSAAGETAAIDAELLSEAISRLVDRPLHPTLDGAVSALAYLAGQREGPFLVARVNGGIDGAYLDPADKLAAFNGMIAMTRELLWRVPELLEAIDDTITGLDDAAFLESLPHLRLGFSALNPRETDEVAARLAARRGASPGVIATDVTYGISEGDVAANIALAAALGRQLERDGLGRWLVQAEVAP